MTASARPHTVDLEPFRVDPDAFDDWLDLRADTIDSELPTPTTTPGPAAALSSLVEEAIFLGPITGDDRVELDIIAADDPPGPGYVLIVRPRGEPTSPGPTDGWTDLTYPTPSDDPRAVAWTGVLAPHMGAAGASVAADGDQQRGGPPAERFVRQPPGNRVARATFLAAAPTPPVLGDDPTRQQCPVRLEALSGHLQPELIETAERGQVRASEGSVRHVEVFQMRRVGTFIFGRPRPLSRQRRADHRYTLNCEEPDITYLPLATGSNLYLATVIDCYSGRLGDRRARGSARRNTLGSAPLSASSWVSRAEWSWVIAWFL